MNHTVIPNQFLEFPDLPAVISRIDELVFESQKLRGAARKEKLAEAQYLATEYDSHCKAGGNNIVQLRNFLDF